MPPLHRLCFPVRNKGSFIHPIPQIVHTMVFATPVVEHKLEHEIAEGLIRQPIAPGIDLLP